MLLALAGCCANDICACQDASADALYFQFQVGGPKGFWYKDIDTVYITRTGHPATGTTGSTGTTSTTGTTGSTTTTPGSTSVLRVLPLIISASGDTSISPSLNTVIINNASPFPSAGSNIKLDAYDYRISTRRVTNGKVIKYSFVVDSIKLAGRYNATGCCTCYENTGKQFDLVDTTHVAKRQVVTTAPGALPITTPLTR